VEGQSGGNPSSDPSGVAELEAAIANVTRLLARTDDAETAGVLVVERRAMRGELETLQRDGARNVIAFDDARRRR
jgi:hypothetical protein